MLGELDAKGIEEVLESQVLARLGFMAEGRVHVVPLTYVYDGTAVYGHTHEGMKTRALRAAGEVCVEVEDVRDLANWRSVLAWGTYEELDYEHSVGALRLLRSRLLPLLPPAARDHGSSARPDGEGSLKVVTFRIPLARKTGRYERVP